MSEMQSDEELRESDEEYSRQELSERLDVMKNQIEQLEKKAFNLKLEAALMLLEVATKIEATHSVNAFHSIQQKMSEFKVKSESEDVAGCEANYINAIEDKESHDSIDVKLKQQ